MFFFETNENDCKFWSTTSWLAITTILYYFGISWFFAVFFRVAPQKGSHSDSFPCRKKMAGGENQPLPNLTCFGIQVRNMVTKQHPKGAFPTWLPWPPKKKMYGNTHILFNHWLDVRCPFYWIHHPASYQTIWISGSASQWTKSSGPFLNKKSPHISCTKKRGILTTKL